MKRLFDFRKSRYPESKDFKPDSRVRFRMEQRRLAIAIGAVAIGLPIFLAVLGSILSQFRLGKFTKSLSQFYYQGLLLSNIFVGCLFLLGTLLLIYRGSSRQVGQLASIMGVFIFVIALFPSAGWVGQGPDVRLYREETHLIHGIASAIVFALLAYFALVVFTRVSPHQLSSDGRVTKSKRKRNTIYRICGMIILLAMVTIGAAELLPDEVASSYRIAFWAEAFMLAAAGLSWLVQARAVPRALLDERDLKDKIIFRSRNYLRSRNFTIRPASEKRLESQRPASAPPPERKARRAA